MVARPIEATRATGRRHRPPVAGIGTRIGIGEGTGNRIGIGIGIGIGRRHRHRPRKLPRK
jgi:hypothetical protein